MKDDIRFYASLSLENHPIYNEKDTYRKKYINALGYFIEKYSKEDIYSRELLKIYNEKLNKDFEKDFIENKDDEKNIKKICSLRIKGFKIFTYKYVFLCDCLFINAFDKPDLARQIIDEFKALFHSRYWVKIDELYDVLYNDKIITKDFKLAEKQIDSWIKNKRFIGQTMKTIALTATVSAGKSTLINSIIGKNIVRSQNESCTSKCYKIYDKQCEDDLIGTIGDKMLLDTKYKELMNLNNIRSNEIRMATFMQNSLEDSFRYCIIDTPGVNSHMDVTHSSITHEFLRSENYDILIYLINAENIGAEDDLNHIRYIFKNVPENKLVFVLNKLDRFRLKEDSISESIQNIYCQLKSVGYNDPTVVPVSAFAGGLFKRVLTGSPLNEDETDECIMLLKKFSRDEFDLSKYYKEEVSWKASLDYGIDKYTPEQVALCLRQSGLLSLEKLINRGDLIE